MSLTNLRQTIAAHKHRDEHDLVTALLESEVVSESQQARIQEKAKQLVKSCRDDAGGQTMLDSFLLEFGLSNKEGVALMCLAEALLRVPDALTADRLIAEKIDSGDWQDHSGKSESLFVNFATWGMILTGKLVQLDSEITQKTSSWMQQLSSNLSEPVVRHAMLQAMKIMGGQYVLGRDINEGIRQGKKLYSAATRYSFDMLGEGARTSEDAERYFEAYKLAFKTVGENNIEGNVYDGNGVSVKLSALYPRYEYSHLDLVQSELYPKLFELCQLAKQYDIGLSIDAEEANRLDMSLGLFEKLCDEPKLQDWDGLGFVMQAYQKRAPDVANWLVALAKARQRKIMVRLVKGAYWDAEIKHAQDFGLEDYPVFTRKEHTDLCYLQCAKTLLSAPDNVYAQFATHNAYTAIAVQELATAANVGQYEFQRLYGMGELLYDHLQKTSPVALRVYAPIGKHQDLLPYLVRRLLENGANSSFVNRFLDDDTPIDNLVSNLLDDIRVFEHHRHSKIAKPVDIFLNSDDQRANSQGIDLDEPVDFIEVQAALEKTYAASYTVHSIVDGKPREHALIESTNPARKQVNPSDGINLFSEASEEDVEQACKVASDYQKEWQQLGAQGRAAILENMAITLEANTAELVALIAKDAGRTLDDGVSEVREAVDFCRYYAREATAIQTHTSGVEPQGVFVCISPWNFPLAIFTGQIVAALATGNTVIAKPAEQTSVVAIKTIELFYQAGLPHAALQCLLGNGARLGSQLINDSRISGVAFTGSNRTADIINRQLGQRSADAVPLIAETGGQNCMIVDSTALAEQVVDDVISSGFHSAGQRCSALRVLYLQDVIADKVITMLRGAMQHVEVGDPSLLKTDVGPVIDQAAWQRLQDHAEKMQQEALSEWRVPIDDDLTQQGTYFAPRVYEIESIKQLKEEVFGPIVHIIRYSASDIESVLEDINSTGFGLTLGVHSRIQAFADYVYRNTHAGNTYVNRNIIGAVVGVNPFGGHGLSGTGPKAGGEDYLYRFLKPAIENGGTRLSLSAMHIAGQTLLQTEKTLPGPTGESNVYRRTSVGKIGLLVGDTLHDALLQTAKLILATGNQLSLVCNTEAGVLVAQRYLHQLDSDDVRILKLSVEEFALEAGHQAFVCSAHNPEKLKLRRQLANRPGPICQLVEIGGEFKTLQQIRTVAIIFMNERTQTDNLVARGGNTQLFNLDESLTY